MNFPKLEQAIENSSSELLMATAEKINEKYQINVSTILKHGPPARSIIEASEESDADLIVVGNRGTGGIFSWMLGSVSRSVVEACTVPVLVVKNQKFCKI
jgi:nucleotide-binding universal stress UspA family protein